MNKKPIMISHKNCPDGFGAIFVFWLKYQDTIEYYELEHKPIPRKGLDFESLKDRDIWMVDISLSRDDLLELKSIAKSLTVLDHHITAKNDLDGLDFCLFDMNHSGAMLAWNYCFPRIEPLDIIKYIEDRDIFKWKYEESNAILTVLDTVPRDLQQWKIFSDRLSFDKFALTLEGNRILLENQRTIDSLLVNKHILNVAGHKIYFVNTSIYKSAIGNILAKDSFCGGTYHYDGLYYIFSLRSTAESRFSVENLAKKFGGGGHYHAAGFYIKSLDELDI